MGRVEHEAAKLDAAQKAWRQFVDKDCTWQSSNVERGTLENVNYGSCKNAQTKRRLDQLKQLLHERGPAPAK